MTMPFRKVILLSETNSSQGRGLLRGIVKYAYLHGPWTFYRDHALHKEPTHVKKIIPRLKKWQADGIITRIRRVPEEMIAMGLPIIATDDHEQHNGVHIAVNNHLKVGKIAAEHLLERGFRNFAYCGYHDMRWSKGYGKYFEKRISEAGFKTDFFHQPRLRVQYLWERQQKQLVNWLNTLPKPVGLMACNDECSQHVVGACNLSGLHIPDNVAIIGVDDDDLICELSNPQLSSVAVNTIKAGYEIAERLDKLMSGQKTTNQPVTIEPTQIATRQSTDVMAIEDREVVEAMRYIRQNRREMIQVSDVADAVALSRRVLEKRFRRALDRSIHDEIRRVRVNQIAQMLLKTDLSISQIAVSLGYTSINNIARYFRQEKGMSPKEYRKKHGLRDGNIS